MSVYREGQSRAKVLSNMVKQKRKEKAVRYALLFISEMLTILPSNGIISECSYHFSRYVM